MLGNPILYLLQDDYYIYIIIYTNINKYNYIHNYILTLLHIHMRKMNTHHEPICSALRGEFARGIQPGKWGDTLGISFLDIFVGEPSITRYNYNRITPKMTILDGNENTPMTKRRGYLSVRKPNPGKIDMAYSTS